MKNDKNTNIQELRDELAKFRDERDWKQFHDPKNLAEAISIEAGELQELFLWKDKNQVGKEMNDSGFKAKVAAELSDIIIFAINFANACDIDVTTEVNKKIDKGRKKYPVEKAKGSAKKYTEL
ncbi:nucleotide pyrophosphohydrolase [Patescibacteria group bacterium]